jgi:hypothetical protein
MNNNYDKIQPVAPKENYHEQATKDLEASSIPDDLKKLIAAEYVRLRGLHPEWKIYKAMRKAGEKYNVKFEFNEQSPNSSQHPA